MNAPRKDKTKFRGNENEQRRFGLAGIGVSGAWTVSVDEPVDDNAWICEIDAPRVSLVFQLKSIEALAHAAHFFFPERRSAYQYTPQGRLVLGEFGRNTVALQPDEEDCGRWFLVIGWRGRSHFRYMLTSDEAKELAAALRDAVEDIRPEHR